jgi:hypothetical protein
MVPDDTRTLSAEALASLGRTVDHCRNTGDSPAATSAGPNHPIPVHWKLTTDMEGTR